MFAFRSESRRRRPGLTPMIDVVFLLLVFFMLAARFGSESTLTLALAGTGGEWQGPPRLVEIAPDGLYLNGVASSTETLADEITRLVENPGDPVVLRPRDGADLQRLVSVMEALTQAGLSGLVLVD